LVKQITIPVVTPVRGATFSPPRHTLYVSYGGDGPGVGTGSMLAYDLLTDTVLWNVRYSDGVDSMAITPDGKTIYMPSGELNFTSTWYVIDASNGSITGTIQGGASPHNTVMSLDGSNVYLLARRYNYVSVVSTATNSVIRTIGPMLSGVRPSTINGRQTLIFTTATGFLGFQVSDINTGQVLYTVPVAGFSVPPTAPITAPSHGVSLSPDENELWVMDGFNSYVHVFDVSGLPGSAPRQIADVALSRPVSGLVDPCAYDCNRQGWVLHSRDGRYVFVGDSGDILDVATRGLVANLDPLYNTRIFLEIDWQNGAPISTTTRHGLGYVTDISVAPAITTNALPAATQNSPYSPVLTGSGGATPYTWSIISGALPSGLALNTSSGAISGTPTVAGDFILTVQLSDANSRTAIRQFDLSVRVGPGSGTITLEQSASKEGAGTTSLSVQFTGNNTAGNLIITAVRMSTATQGISISDSAGNTYAVAVHQTQNTDGHQLYLFFAGNIAGGANTVTVTFTGTNNHPWIAVYEYSGLNKANPLDQTAHAEGNNSSPSTGVITTTSANDLVFAAAGFPATTFRGNVSPGNGYALLLQDAGTSRTADEQAILAATRQVAGSFTLSVSTNWSVVMAAFRR
jgi:hypothetical protein